MKPYVIFVAAPSVKRLKDFIRTESTIEPQVRVYLVSVQFLYLTRKLCRLFYKFSL